jgi:GNAT superfamily N-acetyltransferase
MSGAPDQFQYHTIGIDQVGLLQPLWQKLNADDASISAHFSDEFHLHTFQQRKWEFIEKSKSSPIHIQLVSTPEDGKFIAYSLTTLSPEKHGEIDNIFVDRDYRGAGIGTELMHRALAWLDGHGAATKSVTVMFENAPATRFYARFGFRTRTTTLFQTTEHG